MSLLASTETGVGTSTEVNFKTSKKSLKKITYRKQLQIINAVAASQEPVEIATDPVKVTKDEAIGYKQKCPVVAKRKRKLSRPPECLFDLKQSLLNWFQLQLSNDIPVTEEQMCFKAEEIANALENKHFKCTDDWLLDFRISNNIFLYNSTTDTDKNCQLLLDWLKQNEEFDKNNVYIGGTCGLWHSLDLDRFVSSTNEENQISLLIISNITGSNKQQLTVVGKEVSPIETETKSLPVIYFQCVEPFFSYHLLQNILKIWDENLKSEHKQILLLLDITEHSTNGLQLDNIILVHSSKLHFISSLFQRLVNCFKYHYRRLQLMQTFRYSKAISQQQLLEYINLISLAWHCVSRQSIHCIFYPLRSGCLYFNVIMKDQIDNEENDSCSLLQWCKMYDIPIKLENDSILDKYVYCDKDLASLCKDFSDLVVPSEQNIFQMWDAVSDIKQPTAIDVFQAMKKLVRYLESESASSTTVDSAKMLEDKLECEALSEIEQRIISDDIIENAN